MSLSYDIIKELYFTNRNFCSEDYDRCVEHIAGILECNILTFEGPEPCNGWVIPPKWDLVDAWIKKDGEVIYNAADHPLKVIALSLPVSGTFSAEELKAHMHHKTYFWPDGTAIPFHYRHLYQPWNRNWGFNVPRDFYESIEDGDYEVLIETREGEGNLRIIEVDQKGESDTTFVFVAHLDHPGMANDDLAGCAVGVELFKRLKERSTKFSYKLVLLQEITGAEFYLNHFTEESKANLQEGLFLEMLGTDTPLVMHKTKGSSSVIDALLPQVLADKVEGNKVVGFGEGVTNDEIVFEAHGIPLASLNRFPYNAYHTDKDNLEIINEDALQQSLEICEELINRIEAEILVQKKFEGLVCLSNPEYDLYVDLGQTGEFATDELRKLRKLMDGMGYLKRSTTVGQLASEYEISREAVLSYLRKWQAKGLIDLI